MTEADGKHPPPAPRLDPAGEPILHTRFTPPALPAVFLRRDRLMRRLDRAEDTSLTLVIGSAGAGKTLLVTDWAATLDRPVAWLTADRQDRAPGIFWAYVLEALRHVGLRLPDDIRGPALPGAVDHILLVRLAAHLARRDEPVFLVLDEFDRACTAQIAEQLQFVVRYSGARLRPVVVTRTEPLLPVHRYRAADDLTEIRGADLAFTTAEADVLLHTAGLRLPDHSVRALVERTQGWAAGLRLCSLAARQSSDPERYVKEFEAGVSTVADFLLSEVLRDQPAPTRDLLLRTSVVERFDPALADALTGRGDARRILDELCRQNAFVEPLGRSWYRLHPLFAEILRAHLRVLHPGLETALHARAARWLDGAGRLTEALTHGAAAEDWDFTAGTLVDRLAVGRLRTGLQATELAAFFSRMGPEAGGPAADLVRATDALHHYGTERGLLHLRRAERALEGEADNPRVRLTCALLRVLAARLTGAPDMAERAAADALELRRSVPEERLHEHPELMALLMTDLGSSRLWAGRFDGAREALSAAAGAPGGACTAVPRHESLSRLALIDLLNGWPGRAEKRALAAVAEAERFGLPQSARTGVGRLVLASVALDRDELEEAREQLSRVTGEDTAGPDPVAAALQVIAGARLSLARGNPRRALKCLEDADLVGPVTTPSPWVEDCATMVASAAHLAEGRSGTAAELWAAAADHSPSCAVAAAQARLTLGDVDGAVAVLEGIPVAGRDGPAVAVGALLVRAQAADLGGDRAEAERLLVRALVAARRERLRRPFTETRRWIGHLSGAPPARAAARGWLVPGTRLPDPASRAVDAVSRTVDAAPLPAEQLSAREREVLERLAQMLSVEEIAAQLYVSVNTVKTHLKNVYRKLGVNRRGEAVRRARAWRLL